MGFRVASKRGSKLLSGILKAFLRIKWPSEFPDVSWIVGYGVTEMFSGYRIHSEDIVLYNA